MQGPSLWGRSWSWARISSFLTNIFIVSGKPCFQAVGMRALEDIRLNMAEPTKENVDLIILANMQQNRFIQARQNRQPRIRKERSDVVHLLSSFFLADRFADQLTFLLMESVYKGTKTFVNTMIIMDLGQGGMVMLENTRTMHFQYLMNKA